MTVAPDHDSVLPDAAQRRYLTILFSDLSDSTRITSKLEHEHYSDILVDLRRAYQDVIPKHGGTIVQIQGDGVLAIFGYPDVGEDNARRATEAALDLHETVRSLKSAHASHGLQSLSLHTGIHSGLVLFDKGDPIRGRFELLGNATNIAKHLADLAENDEILVSEETLGPESHFFQTGELRRLSLKGRAEPIAVYRVLARAPVSSRFEARARRGLAPFVGRQSELRTLENKFKETTAGQPQYLTISAPAGLGKTRLAEEFLRRAASRDCQIYRGYCEGYLSAEPLQPFVQILRSLFRLNHGMKETLAAETIDRTLAEIDPALLVHRAELLRALSFGVHEAREGDSQRAAAENTIAALRDLFVRLAATRPLVLFIDDWQWADDATRLAVGGIRGLEQRAILLLTATREFAAGDASMSHAQILELAPFTDDEVTESIGRLLPHIDPFVVSEICRYSGGNPLYIEELCHSAAHERSNHRLGRVVGGEAWLNTLVASRAARLPAAEAGLARAAAVIGNVIPSWLLERITGCEEDSSLVRGLAEQDLIFPGESAGTLRFKHGIARDVIYDTIGLAERRAMHLRIAEALHERSSSGGREEVYEALAYHYGAGGQSVEAARFAELAGDKAMAASALDRAQAQYLAALAALDQLATSRENYQRWLSIAQRLAMACVFDPSREPLEVLRRAVTLAAANNDQAAIARAEFWLGNITYALGDARLAIQHCKRALEAARGVGDERLIMDIRTTQGQAEAAACDYDHSLLLLDEAIAVKRPHRSGTRPAVGLSYTLTCKASVLGDRGLFAQAHACFEEALDAVRGANHGVKGSLFCWQSAVYLWQGKWHEAREAALAAQLVAERVKSLYLFAMSRALWAYGGWVLERSAESVQTLIDATSWIEAREREQYISLNYGWLAEVLAASGRYQEARQRTAGALARGRKHDRLGEAMACRAMARTAALGHSRRLAAHYLALAMKAARARGSPHEIAVTQLCQAEIEFAHGERAQARSMLDQAGTSFTAMNMHWHIEQAGRLQARL